MLVYNYDKETKEYTGESTPQINPKKDGEYLIPAYATTITPLGKKEGFTQIFSGTNWEYLEDNRGKQAINTETKEMFAVINLGVLDNKFMLYSEYQKTDEYKQQQILIEKENKKNAILSQINDIDLKRVRAICEPESKTESGKIWLEYYNEQVLELRQQLKEL